MCRYQNDLTHIFYMQIPEYNLVIIGAGCVGIAAAYYALKKGWTVCIVESQDIQSESRYWSSSFSARQNRVQYNEEYLTRYVVRSNQEWKDLEDEFQVRDGVRPTFLHREGALWFGDKNVTTSEGNIKAANAVITQINAAATNKNERLESLFMQKLMEGTPNFMKAFKPYNVGESAESEWDSWSSLFQPDGGSVDMKQSYTKLLQYVRDKVEIKNLTSITGHRKENEYHYLNLQNSSKATSEIKASKILVSVGVYTPYFLKNVLHESHLVDHEATEYVIQEYVASYIKVENTPEAYEVFDNLPNYYNFLDETENLETKEKEYSGYGFRYHDWDNIGQGGERFVKFGTMANRPLNEQSLGDAQYGAITNPLDQRVLAAKRYVQHRMNYLLASDSGNQHFPCPIIFYSGRQTLLDYLNRTDDSIVVQSGGWIGKYYPLLARTAIDMLFSSQETQRLRQSGDVIGNFINRTRFPITSRVNDLLAQQSTAGKSHFTNVVIGAGCSGLYAAYRLSRERRENPGKAGQIGNIGVFELSDRISGRLKSFKFVGTTTPMELGGMRYIPTNHILVNKIITDLGIPSINFSMNGDPIQQAARLAYLRNDYYRMNEWSTTQSSNVNLHTAYRIEGPIVGMDSFQIISFSLYMILTAPENINLLPEVFLSKTDLQIEDEKKRLAELGDNVHVENSWYRNWKNYIYVDPNNSKSFIIGLSLLQWNQLKPILLFRFRYGLTDKQVYLGQQNVNLDDTYPLYKFGFQNVIEAQFGHQAYQFVSEQNGYFSNTSNASYLDQVMTYLLDFGNVSYRTLASGFDQINFAMANVLLSQGGLDSSTEGIFLHHKLVDILPGQGQHKYVLVFHVPKAQSHKQAYNKTSLHHRKKRGHKTHVPALGERTAIPGDSEYDQVRFTTDRIILGMPKKSITNLTHEIDMLRAPIEQNYQNIYNSAKLEFYSIFDYLATRNAITEAEVTDPLTPQQKLRLADLRWRQQKFFDGKGPALSTQQANELSSLSHIELIKSVEPVKNPEVEAKKPAKFDEDPPLTPKDLLKLADATQLMPAMKIVMNFDRNWWDPNLRINEQYAQTYKNTQLVSSVEEMRGVSVTDLPARQALYFSNGPDNLLLASYNDMITTEFWTTLHNNFSKVWERPYAPFRRRVINDSYPESMDIHPAKKVLVKQILKQLSQMHQIQVKEKWVKECIYQFWGNDPYGAGYHNFYSGFYIPAVMKCIRKPWSDQNIHFVGEAYSNETGWVEGAFQTTELLLQRELGLSELVPGYYAGY